MKESYEALKMEVIAFEGDIWTAVAEPTPAETSGGEVDEIN